MLGKASKTLQNECLVYCLDNKIVLEFIIMTIICYLLNISYDIGGNNASDIVVNLYVLG